MKSKIYHIAHTTSLILIFLSFSSSISMKKNYWQHLAPYTKKIHPFIAKKSYSYSRWHKPFITSSYIPLIASRHYTVPQYSKEKSEKYKSIVSWYFQDDTKQKLSEPRKIQELQNFASFFPTETIEAFLKASEKNQTEFLNVVRLNQQLKNALIEAAQEQKQKLNKYTDGRKLLTAILGKEHITSEPPEYKTYVEHQKETTFSSGFNIYNIWDHIYPDDDKAYEDYQKRQKEKKEYEEKMKIEEEKLQKKPETVEELWEQFNIVTRHKNFIPGTWIAYLINKYPHQASHIRKATYNTLLIYLNKEQILDAKYSALSKDSDLSTYILEEMIKDPNILFTQLDDIAKVCAVLNSLSNSKTASSVAKWIASNMIQFIKNVTDSNSRGSLNELHKTIKHVINSADTSTRHQIQDIIAQSLAKDIIINAFFKLEDIIQFIAIVESIDDKNFDLSTQILKGITRNLDHLLSKDKHKQSDNIRRVYRLLWSITDSKTAIPIAFFIKDNIKKLIYPRLMMCLTIEKILNNTTERKQAQDIIAQSLSDDKVIDEILKDESGMYYLMRIIHTIDNAKPLIDYLQKTENIIQITSKQCINHFISAFRDLNLSPLEEKDFYMIALTHEKKLKQTAEGQQLLDALFAKTRLTGVEDSAKSANPSKKTIFKKLTDWVLHKFYNQHPS